MILVSPLSGIAAAIERFSPSHLMSLLDPASMIDTPFGIKREFHLKVGVNDIATQSYDLTPPQARHVIEIIEFVKGWDQSSPMLIHCWAGISRSSAAALIALCVHNEPGNEARLAKALRKASKMADPNRLLIHYADQQLNCQGRLIEAVEEMAPSDFGFAFENRLFYMPVDVEDGN
jgi:predicted protein tyrosine phosphatase